MSAFDLIILAIFAFLTLRGVWKGMVSQIVSAGSFVVCWIVSSRFGGLVAPTIPVESPWNQVAAMAILFLITMVAIRFAYALLEKLIRHWHLDKLNHWLGGLLGFGKALLICMVLTFFAVMISETSRGAVFNSVTGLYLVKAIAGVRFFVPKDSYEFVHTQLDQFQQKVDSTMPNSNLPELKIQSSEAVQQFLQQMQSKTQTGAGSLWGAVTDWWHGKTAAAGEPVQYVIQETVQTAVRNSVQNTVQNTVQDFVQNPPLNTVQNTVRNEMPNPLSVSSPVSPLAALSKPALSKPAVQPAEVDDLFLSRVVPAEIVPATLAPLGELPDMPYGGVSPIADHRVNSDFLLRNSSQMPKPEVPAKVFRH